MNTKIKMNAIIEARKNLRAARANPEDTAGIEAAFAAYNKAAEPINATLREVEKGCRSRMICAHDIIEAITAAQAHLDKISLKKDQIGTRINVDCNAQKFPNAYKGIPESTQFDAEKTASGWVIISIGRRVCGNRRGPFGIQFQFTQSLIANLPNMLAVA